MAEKTTFHVEDMTCGHCEKAIKAALNEALPDADVVIDRSNKIVVVVGDMAVAKQAIEEAGYTPSVG